MDKLSNPNVKKMVRNARKLFFKRGIKNVSVEEICKKSGVSRMMFYRHFPNKDAIAIHIMGQLYDDTWKKFNEILEADMPFAEKVKQIAAVKMGMVEEYSTEFINEFLADEDSELGKFMLKKRQESYEITRKIYTDAQEKGEIRKDIKIDLIMYAIEYVGEMMQNEGVQSMYPDMSELVHEVFALLFYGILSREENGQIEEGK